MAQHNQLYVLKAFGDEDENKEPEVPTPIHETPEFKAALQAELAKAIANETSGLKSKNSEILAEKRKVQEQLNAILAAAEDEKDQLALKNGELDIQALLDKRVNAANATWQERLAAEQSEKEELRAAVEAERGRLKGFQLQQLIGTEALKNEFFQPSALEDLVGLASRSWDVIESGELVCRDKHGNVVMGRDGRAITPKEWIENLSKERPHYFKAMTGSGSRQGSGGGGKTITRAEWQQAVAAATPAEQREMMQKRSSGEIVISG